MMFNRKEIKRLKAVAEQARQYLDGTLINDQWHICSNGSKIRHYPTVLCSCCRPGSGSIDFNPHDIIIPELVKSGLMENPNEPPTLINYTKNYDKDYDEFGCGTVKPCPKCGHEFFGHKRLVCKECRNGG